MNNLEELEQYKIDRDLFVEIFKDILDYTYNNYEGHCYKYWWYDDELYLLHKPSGTMVNWYKHLGRTNTCNKDLSIKEYKLFVKGFINEVKEEGK